MKSPEFITKQLGVQSAIKNLLNGQEPSIKIAEMSGLIPKRD